MSYVESKHPRGGTKNKGQWARQQALGKALRGESSDEDTHALLDDLESMHPDDLASLKDAGESPEELGELFEKISEPDGGFTYQPHSHLSPKRGYVVSPYPERSQAIDAGQLKLADLASYVMKNNDLLEKTDHYFGAWHDPSSDKVFLDVSVVNNDPQKAANLARQYDQIAYFDLGSGKSVTVNAAATSGGQVNAGDDEEAGAASEEQADSGAAREPVHEANRASSDGPGNRGSASRNGAKVAYQRQGVNDAFEIWQQQESRELEHQDRDERRQAAETSRRHRAQQGGQVEQEEVVLQNRERIQASRDRAQQRLAERRLVYEHPPSQYELMKHERQSGERALVNEILADDGLDRLERLKLARREMDKMIRNERAEHRRQPIILQVHPVINIPEIRIPQMPAIVMPDIHIPPQPPPAPIVIPPTIVNVEKPDPVVFNYTPPPAQQFDIKPVRDENGTVISYRRITR